MSMPGPILELLGAVAYHAQIMRPLLPTYLHLLVSAIFPIWTASHASLSRPSSAAPRKPSKGADAGDDVSDEPSTKLESLTPSDALTFPLLAGCTLATLYFILRWLEDPAWLNWVLGLYFSQIGLIFCFKFIRDALALLLSVALPKSYSSSGSLWKVDASQRIYTTTGDAARTSSSPLPGFLRRLPLPARVTRGLWTIRNSLYTQASLKLHIKGLVELKAPVSPLDLVSLITTSIAVYFHTFVSRPWPLTNLLGFSFCYGSLQFITPSTAWTGTLILCALFAYDIYFVFFTPMMVTVATKLDVPIKLLFPRPDGCVKPLIEVGELWEEYLQCVAKKRTMAMLGLGDIVVPGMVIAFALRFDLYLWYLYKGRAGANGKQDAEQTKPIYQNARGSWGERLHIAAALLPPELQAKRFPKPYFWTTVVGYLLGMITTVVVMQVWGHAQPALLYLVPGVLGALWGCALVRGELKLLWDYDESPPAEEAPPSPSDKQAAGDKKTPDTNNKDIAVVAGSDTNQPEETEKTTFSDSEVQKTETASAPGTTVAKDSTATDKQLVAFSITLPDEPGSHSTDADKPSLPPSTNPEGDSHAGRQQIDGPTETEKSSESGRTTRSTERAGNGEPSAKRSRRK